MSEPESKVPARGERARDLWQRLESGRIPFAAGVSVADDVEGTTIVVDVDVERPQVAVHDIRSQERVSIRLASNDDKGPDVCALRSDFPTVPHLNIREPGTPKSLCLFEEPFAEVRPWLTTPQLIERIRDWFRLTARGELHGADQPLEPLLSGHVGHLIVPHHLVATTSHASAPVEIGVVENGKGPLVLRAFDEAVGRPPSGGLKYLALVQPLQPRLHGAISERPRTLAELHSSLSAGGDDLLEAVRGLVSSISSESLYSTRLVILLLAPKIRKPGGPIETVEHLAFLTAQNLGFVGQSVGMLRLHENKWGALVPRDASMEGTTTHLDLLNVSLTVSAHEAARMSGRNDPCDDSFVLLGNGALGSQLALVMARIAFGQWTLVDNDILLPHNTSRHALSGYAVGQPKAEAVCWLANDVLDAQPARFNSIHATFGDDSQLDSDLLAAVGSARAIIDASASILLQRRLSTSKASTARRLSVFMNPRGTDLVLLTESTSRSIRLDHLEMQYYRALLRTSSLKDHLRAPDDRIRYGLSCRDISVAVSEEAVAVHAATAARAIRRSLEGERARIEIWSLDEGSGAVAHTAVPAAKPLVYRVAGWTIVLDEGLRNVLADARSAKLPAETGGALLGVHDLSSRTIYVVDTTDTPGDSEERPSWFVRGTRGLSYTVDESRRITGGQVGYIGEWHSHPPGISAVPSSTDVSLFAWLTTRMDALGLPALMIIVGHEDSLSVFTGEVQAGTLDNDNAVPVF